MAANDSSKPLLSKVLAVAAFRAQYLANIRQIAQKWLDWNRLGPLAQQFQAVIADEIKLDTRKLYSTEAFVTGVAGTTATSTPPGRAGLSLKSFAEKRRAYLLNHPKIKNAKP